MACEHRWIPLESNPKVLNKYIQNLGVDTKWQFVDIYGLDKELLEMVPGQPAAVMLLYPLTDKVKEKEIGDGDDGDDGDSEFQGYFMKQTIPNACGTVALIHALANNDVKEMSLDATKNFVKFLKETKNMTAEERGKFLEKDQGLKVAHEELAQEGDTQAPSRETSVNPHFITFVHSNGHLYELDGRKKGPVNHGKTCPETLLVDAVNVVKKFMERDPDEINFTLMAFTRSTEDQ